MSADFPLLTTKNLFIGYHQRRAKPTAVLGNLSLELQTGELVCLLGANGSGKTTLLRTIAGLTAPISGQVHLLGRPLGEYTTGELAKLRSIVLTERGPGGMLDGRALVALGRQPYTDWLGRLTQKDEVAISRALSLVDAEKLASRLLDQMSDGERKKLTIARALAQEPKILFLDEPTAFLDLPRKVEIMQLLRRLTRETGCSILLATHDLEAALRIADRFWVLGEGGEMACDLPEALMMNGVFARAFPSSTVHFDALHGSFHESRQRGPSIHCPGESIAAIWTRRALRRNGYQIEDSSASQLEVLPEKTGISWNWHHAGHSQEFSNLALALKAIQAELPNQI